MSDQEEILGSALRQLEILLEASLQPPSLSAFSVWQAARYSLGAGGKRIRPELFFRSFLLFGRGLEEEVTAFAAALEMVHTYSLIHDDLPAMDDDDFRRGKPSCHIRFGEATAILAGDLLLNLAYETMIQACLEQGGEAGFRALKTLAGAAGGRGMILGQDRDLAMEKEDPTNVSLQDVAAMASLKTGCLIRAALVMGGQLARAPLQALNELADLGEACGLVFQIRDDILDRGSSRALLGKTPDKDAGAGKKTFVTVGGLDGAQAALEAESVKMDTALLNLEDMGYDVSGLRAYLKELSERTF